MERNEIRKRRVELVAASDSVVGIVTDRDLGVRAIADGLPLATNDVVKASFAR